MIGALTNHLWQSTLFVLAAGLVAAALRHNGAHIRHRVWLIASLKFLVPFSVLISLGAFLPRFAPATTTVTTTGVPSLSIAVDQIAEPFGNDEFLSSAPATHAASTNWMALAVVGVWVSGFVVIAFTRVRGWRRIRAAVRASVPVALASPVPVRSAPGLLEPGVVGLFRPVLLVPAGIEHHLTSAQMDAVLAHELCHVQRRDNLTSVIHMFVEAAFWFHPLVWWVGARLVDERERACDEHVLRVCGEPQAYAESILSVCKLYVESPLACVSGVGGSDLRKRVAAILVNRVGLQLSLVRKVTLAIAAMLAILLPLAAGTLIAPLEAQSSSATGAGTSAQVRKFDVASIKPCGPNTPAASGRSGNAGQGSPGYLFLPCQTLRQLVSRAYLYNQQDHLKNRKWEEKFVPGFSPFIRGGPSWADADTFTIEAKAEGVTDQYTLTGPMMRALLEDRFQLKTHRATEERSIYALTVAKGGFKFKPLAPGDCYEFDPDHPAAPGTLQVEEFCGGLSGDGWGTYKANGNWLGDVTARDGTRFTDELWRLMLQPVIDRTGLNARYDFSLEFTPDENTPGVHGPCGENADCMARLAARGVSAERPATFKSSDTIFKALEKLGLKLEKVKAPAEYLVIDSAQKLRPNGPAEDALPPARAKGAGK
jgi:uncharacterized protein (TIGR03435 family)